MDADLFWLAATTNLLISLRFVLLVKGRKTAGSTATVAKLARGQRQDSWLASAIIWGAILFKGYADVDVLHVGGLVVLAWLAVRTLHRIQVLVQDEKADRGR